MIEQYLNDLTEKRLRAWEAGKTILESAARDARDLTVDERSSWDKIDADITALDAQIKEWQGRAERAAEADAARAAYEGFVRPDTQRAAGNEQDAVLRFLRGESRHLDLDLRAVAREKAAIRAGASAKELRDLTVGTTTAGGVTVPTTFMRELYDYLEVYSGMRRTGATVITTASGEPFNMPRVTSHGTAAIVGEGTALAEADAAFGTVTLTSWKYGQLVQVSSELIADTGVDILGFVARDVARAIGRVTNTAYTTGSGTNQPQGIIGQLGTAVTGGTGVGGSATYGDLIDLVYGVNSEYRAQSPVFVLADASAGAIRKMVDLNGNPMWQPALTVGAPDRLLGFPVIENPAMPALGTGLRWAAFGDFSSALVIRDAGPMRFERSDDFAFSSDLVTFRAIMRTDSKVRDLNAAKVLRGGTA